MSGEGKSVVAKSAPWFLDKPFVFIMLFIFGPLALPLVWFSPRFSITWKIGTTILALVLTALLWQASVQMFGFLSSRLKDIRDAGGAVF